MPDGSSSVSAEVAQRVRIVVGPLELPPAAVSVASSITAASAANNGAAAAAAGGPGAPPSGGMASPGEPSGAVSGASALRGATAAELSTDHFELIAATAAAANANGAGPRWPKPNYDAETALRAARGGSASVSAIGSSHGSAHSYLVADFSVTGAGGLASAAGGSDRDAPDVPHLLQLFSAPSSAMSTPAGSEYDPVLEVQVANPADIAEPRFSSSLTRHSNLRRFQSENEASADDGTPAAGNGGSSSEGRTVRADGVGFDSGIMSGSSSSYGGGRRTHGTAKDDAIARDLAARDYLLAQHIRQQLRGG